MRRSDVQNFFHATDEETEPKVVTCTVGAKPSKAQYYVNDVSKVSDILDNIKNIVGVGEDGAI